MSDQDFIILDEEDTKENEGSTDPAGNGKRRWPLKDRRRMTDRMTDMRRSVSSAPAGKV